MAVNLTRANDAGMNDAIRGIRPDHTRYNYKHHDVVQKYYDAYSQECDDINDAVRALQAV